MASPRNSDSVSHSSREAGVTARGNRSPEDDCAGRAGRRSRRAIPLVRLQSKTTHGLGLRASWTEHTGQANHPWVHNCLARRTYVVDGQGQDRDPSFAGRRLEGKRRRRSTVTVFATRAGMSTSGRVWPSKTEDAAYLFRSDGRRGQSDVCSVT